MSHRLLPITRLTIAFIAGVVLCKIALQWIDIQLWELNAMLIAWAVAIFLLHNRRQSVAFAMAVSLFSGTLGALLFLRQFDGIRYGVAAGTQHLTGVIADQPQRKAKTWAVRVHTDSGADVLAYLSPDAVPEKGDSIELFACYGAEPTCLADNPDTAFADYHNYLFYSGISATAYSPSGMWRVTGHRRPSGLKSRLEAVQTAMTEMYREAGFRGEEGAIITAMTTGDRSQLSKPMRQQYSRAGVAHILALSGFHLGIIYVILQSVFVTLPLGIRWRNCLRLVIIAALVAFTIVAGSPPSLVRAAIMFTVMMIASLLQRDNLSLNSLSLAALVMLCYQPMMLFDVGFQLSFLSMLGLTLAYRPLVDVVHIRCSLLHRLWSVVVTTVVCTVFTLPLVTYYFGYFSLMSLVSNLVVPLLAIAMMWLTVAWWALVFLPSVQTFIGDALTFVVHQMNDFTHWASSVPWAVVPFRSNLLGVVLEYVVMLALTALLVRIYHNVSRNFRCRA